MPWWPRMRKRASFRFARSSMRSGKSSIAREQATLQAFADGVNAAMKRETTPAEFRILNYDMQPWRPQDSLAVSFATVLDLTDDWNDIAVRIGNEPPLTDPCFDAPVTEGLAHIADPAHCSAQSARSALIRSLLDARPPIGSNEWAAGAAHTASHRALLANDPHLHLAIPGVWYLVDMQSPGFHVAGAALVGTPGVTLGHNDDVAWGATNGTVTALSIFDAPPSLDATKWQTETFHVRFARDVTARYYRGVREFGATINAARSAALCTRTLERLRDAERAVDRIQRPRPSTHDRGCARSAARLSRTDAELRTCRRQRSRRLPTRRCDPERSALVARHSPGIRPWQAVPTRTIRRTSTRRGFARCNRVDVKQQDVRRIVIRCDFPPRSRHRAAPIASHSCYERARRTTSPISLRCRWTRSRCANAR